MDLKRKEKLLEKYWNAETSLEEEAELKDQTFFNEDVNYYFRALHQLADIQSGHDLEQQIFSKIQQLKKQSIRRRILTNLRIAASLLVLFALFFLIIPKQNQKNQIARQEALDAYKLTKQTLMLFSVELNKAGQSYLVFNEFEETINKIKLDSQNYN